MAILIWQLEIIDLVRRVDQVLIIERVDKEHFLLNFGVWIDPEVDEDVLVVIP
jgi:hypothetical protein